MKKIIYTIDVEPDLHTEKEISITKGLIRFEKLCDKHSIKPILFVTGEVLEKHFNLFQKFQNKGWEISCHGLTHKRFDEMSYEEKEDELRKCILIWKKYLGNQPKGFRASQHSIDEETLDLLEKLKFKYDSSYHPLNFLQLIFFPKKFKLWFKLCFSKLNNYKIRENLLEKPLSSLGLPFVSLIVRIFPLFLLKLFYFKLSLFYKKPMFYAHSWDFINLPESRIDNMFSHKKLLNKLDSLMAWNEN